MLKIECNEKRPRFETEPLADGRTLVRLYEDEEAASCPAVSDMDTPWNGYRYTTYETRIALPAGALETAPDIWAEAVKQTDRAQAAAQVRTERDRLLLACDWAVLPDAKTERTAWETYRQALRDVPEQVGFPYGIDWPIRPGTGGLK